MNNIFVVSDSHFSHLNICGPTLSKWSSGYRNFTSLDEMNSKIINNINSVVREDDILWHLGDFAMGNRSLVPDLRKRIICKNIHILWGNHDGQIRKQFSHLFASTGNYFELRINNVLVTMMHFPIASWNESGRGAINLHGHSHGRYKPVGRQKDVGVDCNNFIPLNLEDLVAEMVKIPIVEVDGHTKETKYG